MKLNIISDIHRNVDDKEGNIKWETFDPTKLEPADYLIVAGDLGLADNYDRVLNSLKEKVEGKFKDVLAVKGNHDFWDMSFMEDKRPDAKDDRYVDVVDGDVAIFGVSMWTPVNSLRDRYMVERNMNDMRWIPHWNAEYQTQYYKECRAWIIQKYREYEGKKRVIVTHHCPRQEMIDDEYRYEISGDSFGISATYCVTDRSLDDLKPVLWACGHTHSTFDETIDGVRYVRNPIGYHGTSWNMPDDFSEVPQTTWYNKVVEV
jgi:predicted phosphodiesterase